MLLVNMSQDKSNINPYISNTLLKEIEKSLKENKKSILYLNKRGEYSSLICNKCNHLYQCKNCDISMSVHKYPEQLICHLCNEKKQIPIKCEKCDGNTLQKVGIGTQQIEDSLKKYFSNSSHLIKETIGKSINIFRFDTDTVKNKTEKSLALENLEKADIIIGTKMITTGFNFEKVGLIGVILLEQELLIPNYNTEEKVYSNINQLLGRGSRKGEISNVVIQTHIPNNDVIKNIIESNYKEFFIKTLEERKLFNYPPYSEMLTLEYRHKKQEKALSFISNIKNKLELELNQIKSIQLKTDNLITIQLIPNYTKKYNQFYYKIIIKGKKLREFINCIKPEIMRNSSFVVIFD